MTQENPIAVTQPEAAPTQLLTIEPKQYVDLVFNPFRERFATAVSETQDVTYDITTTAGMKLATECRAKFRNLRIEAEKTRQDRKAPILEIGRLLDETYRRLEVAVTPHEKKHDSVIKAEEARKEKERQAKIEAERKRIADIQHKIAQIREYPVWATGRPADIVRQKIDELKAQQITDAEYQEFIGAAESAKWAAIETLQSILTAAEKAEAEAKRIAEERAELERQKHEQEAEAKRLAAVAAQEQAERDAQLQKEREALQQQQRELEAQRKAIDLEREAIEQRKQEQAPAPADEEKAGKDADVTDAPLTLQEVAQAVLPSELQPVVSAAPRQPAKPSRPSDKVILSTLAMHFHVHESAVIAWLLEMDLTALSNNLLN
jgi:colicin import membrane protein